MKLHIAQVNQWDANSWPFPTRTLFALNIEGMAECPGCGHTEVQIQLFFFGLGLVFVIKWNGEEHEHQEEKDLKPSTNPA